MKKISVLIIVILSVLSCSDEIKFNTPAIQGKKDGNLWRATFFEIRYNDGGRLEITGANSNERVVFTVPNIELDRYRFGRGSSSKAVFEDENGITYSTNSLPDPDFQLYPPDGEMVITQITATSISGTFRFNAFSQAGTETVNFSQGVFFDVPLSGLSNGLLTCNDARDEAQAAEELYNNTDPASAQYTEVCLAYKAALQQQIATCGGGGANSPIQIIINGLGDCQ